MALSTIRFARGLAALACCLGLWLPAGALAQSPEHVAAAAATLEKSPVRGNCAPVQEDFLGWPANLMQKCEYQYEDMPGLAYVLDVKPETLARWVEAGCSALMVGASHCFDRTLKCAFDSTGAVFVIGGNLIAARNGVKKNRFYRNGVAIVAPNSGAPGAVPIAEQEQIAHIAEKDVSAMLDRGGVAFWNTMPYQFAVKAIELGVPAEMNTPDRREKWLEIVRVEMLKALDAPENRFLSGWISAHPITLRAGECPDSRDP
ncbi:MAG: hypothetical protein HYS63_07720 [Methylocystis sp.]|nr:hypothetical protein [Methylocystis sp.]